MFIYGVPQPAMWDVSTVTDGGCSARQKPKALRRFF